MTTNKSIKFFQENYLIFSLICYGVGLLTTYCKFYLFDIPILYYVSILDILLYPIIQIIIVAFVLFIYSVFYRRLVRYFIVVFFRRNKKYDTIKSNLMFVPFFIIFFSIKIFGRDLGGSDSIMLLTILPIGIFMINSYHDKKSYLTEKFILRFLSISFVFIIILLVFNEQNKLYSNNKTVCFTYNDSIEIMTEKSKFYIGETSTHLIIYDTLNNMSEIYKKDNIDNLKYFSEIEIPKKTMRRPNQHK